MCHTQIHNWQDFANSPDLSAEAEAAFEEGISLWKKLQTELASNYQVVYLILLKVLRTIQE
jgi:hypothetical protein